MPFQKGHKLATGRKTIEEELAMYKEKIKQVTIEELATSRVYKRLEDKDDDKTVEKVALPVYLKSKAEKVEHSGEVSVKTFNFIKNEEHNTHN